MHNEQQAVRQARGDPVRIEQGVDLFCLDAGRQPDRCALELFAQVGEVFIAAFQRVAARLQRGAELNVACGHPERFEPPRRSWHASHEGGKTSQHAAGQVG